MLTATVAIGGMQFGPHCAKVMGFIPAQPHPTKTHHRPVKRTGRIIQKYLKKDNLTEELFEGFTV